MGLGFQVGINGDFSDYEDNNDQEHTLSEHNAVAGFNSYDQESNHHTRVKKEA